MQETQVLKRKLAWQCRRGMLEIDMMLQPFLANGFEALSAEEQKTFVRLLEETDQDLFIWLLGGEEPTDPELATLVKKIREFPR